jgi:hypothetical protein
VKARFKFSRKELRSLFRRYDDGVGALRIVRPNARVKDEGGRINDASFDFRCSLLSPLIPSGRHVAP